MQRDENGNYSAKGILHISPNESVFDMLHLLRRPKMYLSSVSIVALSDFMNAYLMMSSYAVRAQWEKFTNWLLEKKFPNDRDRFGHPGQFSFHNLYKRLCKGSNKKAVELFLAHVEEYKLEFGITVGKYGE